MDHDYKKELSALLTKMTSDYSIVRKAANKPSRSTLMITNYRQKDEFYAVTYKNGRRIRKQINKDPERIYRLAHKAYLSALSKRMKFSIALLNKVLERMPSLEFSDILPELPKHYDVLEPFRVIDPSSFWRDFGYPNPSRTVPPSEARLSAGILDPLEWACEPYCENTDHVEFKIHQTRQGIMCRSKSEALLIEIYHSLEIPFHYDETITIGGVMLSPDLIGVRRDGSLIYHEHRGLHSEEYRARYDWKSGVYASAGIFPGSNLLYTYDTPEGGLNIKLAEMLIKDIYRL